MRLKGIEPFVVGQTFSLRGYELNGTYKVIGACRSVEEKDWEKHGKGCTCLKVEVLEERGQGLHYSWREGNNRVFCLHLVREKFRKGHIT